MSPIPAPPRIYPGGREWVKVPATGVPDDAGNPKMSFDAGTTWHDAEWVGDGDARDMRVMVAHPAAPPEENPAGTVVLPAGTYFVLGRLPDPPGEDVIRPATGAVRVG